MSMFIKEYVDGCAVCQSTKTRPKTQVPLRPNQIPMNIWGIITMDFIMDLPLSKGHNSLFVVVNRLSKATILSPCNKTITAEETSHLYLDNVWRRTGLPHQVISDQGPQFTSKVMQEIWNKLGDKLRLWYGGGEVFYGLTDWLGSCDPLTPVRCTHGSPTGLAD